MIVSSAKAAEAAAVLGVQLEGLCETGVARAFREASKLCHPDHHGYEYIERWSRISWAREVLKYWLTKNPPEQTPVDNGPPCLKCQGEGRLKLRRAGFGKPLTVQCPACKGQGVLLQEKDETDG